MSVKQTQTHPLPAERKWSISDISPKTFTSSLLIWNQHAFKNTLTLLGRQKDTTQRDLKPHIINLPVFFILLDPLLAISRSRLATLEARHYG